LSSSDRRRNGKLWSSRKALLSAAVSKEMPTTSQSASLNC